MKIGLLILNSPYASAACNTAQRYADAALRAGHEIPRIFFYHEGVYQGSGYNAPAQDEENSVSRWAEISQSGNTELILCVASASRRGIHDETESRRHNLGAANIHPEFTLAGLGQLIEAAQDYDRLLTFG